MEYDPTNPEYWKQISAYDAMAILLSEFNTFRTNTHASYLTLLNTIAQHDSDIQLDEGSTLHQYVQESISRLESVGNLLLAASAWKITHPEQKMTSQNAHLKFYQELAKWWPLISAPEDYADEAAFFLKQLEPVTSQPDMTLLELGSGGGNNALHMKGAFAAVTLVDLSEGMLTVSRKLNPDCEHLQGDMRTVRLHRTFDAVFIHDAIDYMLTESDLRQAIETAYVHCKSGGMVVLVPDHVRENFEPDSGHGGHDGDGQAVRYLEWTVASDETTYTSDYVFIIRDGDKPVEIVHDQHTCGLFPLETWLAIMRDIGFETHSVIDEYDRYVFVGRKN